jgi:hypothetical protein
MKGLFPYSGDRKIFEVKNWIYGLIKLSMMHAAHAQSGQEDGGNMKHIFATIYNCIISKDNCGKLVM